MAQILPQDEFADWPSVFLPGIVSGSPPRCSPRRFVSDASDGQIAHVHGLNASRAWCWRRIAESLPAGDPRVESAEAALPHVVRDEYLVEHWLTCCAVLLLS
jgi:hypothetical protein